jgi:hypothetical protein
VVDKRSLVNCSGKGIEDDPINEKMGELRCGGYWRVVA